jgi:hypothetical protein
LTHGGGPATQNGKDVARWNAARHVVGRAEAAKSPTPDDSLAQLAASSFDAMVLSKLEQLPFGRAASLSATVSHTWASRPIALAASGRHPSGHVAVEYIAVGVLLQPTFKTRVVVAENYNCHPLTSP